MFQRVLIANRGEIAVRIARTLRRIGVRSIAVYSDADAGARHVLEADTAVRIGPAAARESYLSIPRIIEAAVSSGAEAVHPGYGFLAENVDFARACADAGLVFVGPPVGAIDAMGDKIRAKQTVMAAGVPVVPGRTEPGMTDADLVSAAAEIGFPVLLKPSAGGGGKGMRLVTQKSDLAAAIESARREALGSFGDDTLLIERFVQRPRHIEIQVLADNHGTVIHLGERECSLQRRHQKIIEEAPSPLLTADMRSRMGASAVDAARAVGYTGAGTVECIVSADRPDEFFFMEMNTRLQVEHPVTELVTGLDLVEWQLRVASGERLPMSSVELTGHAVEARVYAEDPSRDFLPTGGTVLDVVEPDGVRVDSGLRVGSVVGSDYDPMLAKVIAWAPTRSEALGRLSAALADTAVLGVGTNVAYLRDLLADPDVVAGRLDTQLVSRRAAFTQSTPDHVFVAAAMDELLAMQPSGPVVDPWDVPSGWRIGGSAGFSVRLDSGDRQVTVRVVDGFVSVGSSAPLPAVASVSGSELRLTYDGRTYRYRRAKSGSVLWLASDGFTWSVAEHSLLEESSVSGAEGGPITSPMPGTVLVVKASVGDRVAAGTPLLVVEAMKMEHTIAAPVDGVLTELHVQAGQQVALNQALALVIPEEQT
ncbi:acetyl/propionyl/methylcrotonyl-CoA carboxylase subunit alpha [Kibdelosporangium persicum]|uniref:biotin carboxylase n=1 Tax=Kibdelosporangium persicum TaxID=2698649 RepID=A0ABX2FH99_9PSEU|nr:acetyl/propionyl/methylcrotonyl-CoA carboxylase subunit alpha [Kibdelosporangium persicum]NRN70250.1 Methylcrotonyl-CoA carboxylase biotin-containing subunit [Kibdelosporangium persicum]